MKMKTQLTLATVVAAGLLASGCSQQMVAQQAVAQQVAPKPVVKTIVDCSKCRRPVVKPRPRPRPATKKCWHGRNAKGQCNPKPGNRYTKPRPCPVPKPAPISKPAPAVNPDAHTHPAIPNCTNSIRHVHPNGRRAHSHRYSCRKPVRRQHQQQRCWYGRTAQGHCRPAPVRRHQQKRCWHGRNAQGQCRPAPMQRRQYPLPRPKYQRVTPVIPKVKAKGTYRGPIKIDGVLQQYQQ